MSVTTVHANSPATRNVVLKAIATGFAKGFLIGILQLALALVLMIIAAPIVKLGSAIKASWKASGPAIAARRAESI